MGFDNDCIVNIQSLAGEYFCAVCRTLVYPNEAIQAPCTHLYCKPCLKYVVSTTHACAYDGYRVTEADSKSLLESNKILADTIGKIQVHCLFYRTGCTWEGSLSDCTIHCATCTFGESAVLCNRCGLQLKHREVQDHAQTCSGVQSQVQQPSGVQGGTSTGDTVALDQTQTAVQKGVSAPHAMPQASTTIASSQVANQTANSATQPQAAQAAMLTPEQMYQQQLQYQQQYYQQYPGYDPYQQNYQYYYQYPQQPTQAYPQPQPQPQGYGQTQTQSIVQAQQQVQPQAPVQSAQPPLHPLSQTGVNSQPVAPSAVQVQTQIPAQGQPQAQMPAHGQAQHPNPAQAPAQSAQPPLPHAPYNQSQLLTHAQPLPQQPHVAQYPHTHPQFQHPHAQSQTQHYPHTQPHVQLQPHSQANLQGPPVHPSQQPYPPQSQTPNAVTGYLSYPPPPQLHSQAQAGTGYVAQITGAQQSSHYPNQMHGQYPMQTAQMHPQSVSNVPNHQQPVIPSAQGQAPYGPSVQQQPVYPQAQQPGYPFQQRPSLPAAQQAAPQQYGQQQSFGGKGSFVQHQPSMAAQCHGQGPSQMPPQSQQNYGQLSSAQPNVAHAGRPMGAQAVAHPYAQATGHAGASQVRPPLFNQNYPLKGDNQLLNADHQGTLSQRGISGEKSCDPVLEKGVHDKTNTIKDGRDKAMATSAGIREDEMKMKVNNGSVASADGNDGENNLSGSKQMPDAATKVNNQVQEAKPNTKVDAGESASKIASDANKSGTEDHGDALKKPEVHDLKNTAKHAADNSATPSAVHKPHVQSQVRDPNSYPSTDHGRNQLHPVPYGQHKPDVPSMPQSMTNNPHQPAFPGHPSNQFRPQGPGQAPSSAMPPDNRSGGIHGPGSSGSLGRPGNVNYHQGNLPPHQDGQSHYPLGNPFAGPSVNSHRPGASRYEIEKFEAQRSGQFDGRQPDSHPHEQIERTSFDPAHRGIPLGDMKFGGPSAHDPMSAPGMRDERSMPFVEEQLRRFPGREFEDDFRKFPRPPHLETGPSSNYGRRFPSSGPLDHGSQIFDGDGMLRSFDRGPHGFDRDPTNKKDGTGSGPSRVLHPFHPENVGERGRAFLDHDIGRADFGRPDFSGPLPGPGFGRHRMDGLPPRSPGRDYPGFPSQTFGPYGDAGGNESRSFEGSKQYNFSGDPLGKPTHESRFPVPPRVDHVPGNVQLGEHFAANRDLMPSHLRRGGHMGVRSLHLGEATAFGRPGGLSEIEPPLGNFPPHVPFGDSFGGEKPGHRLHGEPGFRGGYGFPQHGHDGGFYPREMDPFDDPRKRKPGSVMCRICKVECGTVDGLDLHSQSREHQRKARDMVLSIKQQNNKRLKVSKDQASAKEERDGGRTKNSGFQGRGNKR